jgi:hypothetical protein
MEEVLPVPGVPRISIILLDFFYWVGYDDSNSFMLSTIESIYDFLNYNNDFPGSLVKKSNFRLGVQIWGLV